MASATAPGVRVVAASLDSDSETRPIHLTACCLLSIMLELAACSARHSSVSAHNVTGRPPPQVSCCLASTDAAGSAPIDDGPSASFALDGNGPPMIELAIACTPVEKPQDVERIAKRQEPGPELDLAALARSRSAR